MKFNCPLVFLNYKSLSSPFNKNRPAFSYKKIGLFVFRQDELQTTADIIHMINFRLARFSLLNTENNISEPVLYLFIYYLFVVVFSSLYN